MDVFEAIETCQAMRYLKPDPVPDELVARILRAATCAPSPGNSQGWDFVVVRDAATRAELARAMETAVRPLLPSLRSVKRPSAMLVGAHYLLDHLADVPVWIFVCGRPVYPPSSPDEDWIWPAVYPAAQNLVLAARALGLGTAFTTYHIPAEERVRAILGLPDDCRIAVTVPLGWPARPFQRVRRRPIEEVVHWERW